MSLLAFFAIAFGFMFAIEKTKNSSAGVFVLLGFTFFMGLMLSRILGFVLGFSNGPSLIMLAFGGTGVIFASMATIATVSKRDFSGLGKWLFMGVIVLLLASVANVFLHLPALMLTVSVMAIVIFLGVHAVRRAARRERRRDELHHRGARDLSRPVQRVREPAGAARHFRRQPQLGFTHRTSAALNAPACVEIMKKPTSDRYGLFSRR